MYVVILTSLIKKSRQANNGQLNYQQIRQQFIAAMSLAVLFGVGWGFGFAATKALPVEAIRLPMEIIFVVLTSFQGLFLFLFQCVYSKSVRDIWLKLECISFKYKRQMTVTSTHTSKTETLRDQCYIEIYSKIDSSLHMNQNTKSRFW